MATVGCVNAFEDEAFLRESLPALARAVDRIVLVDGRYAHFPCARCPVLGARKDGRRWVDEGGEPVRWPCPDCRETAASSDGTVAVARSMGCEVVEAPARAWASEIEKRNAYLDRVADGDWCLVVDADEIVEGGLEPSELEPNEDWLVDLYRIDYPTKPGQTWCPIHRLFLRRPGIRYAGTHHAVHVGDRLVHPRDLPVKPGIRLRHLTSRRDAARQARKGAYYDLLSAGEAEFRAAHGGL